jgi:hypothetical protein
VREGVVFVFLPLMPFAVICVASLLAHVVVLDVINIYHITVFKS